MSFGHLTQASPQWSLLQTTHSSEDLVNQQDKKIVINPVCFNIFINSLIINPLETLYSFFSNNPVQGSDIKLTLMVTKLINNCRTTEVSAVAARITDAYKGTGLSTDAYLSGLMTGLKAEQVLLTAAIKRRRIAMTFVLTELSSLFNFYTWQRLSSLRTQ